MDAQQIIDEALRWSQNPSIDNEDRNEIKNLIDNKDISELTERFYKDLEFGTGGLRAILGNGKNRINKYTIRKATQAVINAIKELPKSEYKMAICYDSRKFSKEFAMEVASVCAANKVHAYLYNRLNPVALLSYAVRELNCDAGVMVTASHNPPKYNGFKVFWSDGAQVTPPNDRMIINHYNKIQRFEDIPVSNFEDSLKKGLISILGEDIEDKYHKAIKSKMVSPSVASSHGENLKVVFTPIHGTGLIPCTQALKESGFSNVIVPSEQAQPDHRFPTVKSPNPENPEALAIAIQLMQQQDADIVMGTDPDTDRLGVAVQKEGSIFFPNGNQIGTLMLHYILTQCENIPKDSYFVKTIVTTDLQRKIAEKFGVKCENTLTGFKWICGRVKEIEELEPSRNFLFGTEESFGYLHHPFVRDKDAVSSVVLMAEVALHYKLKGMSLYDALNSIYEEFGYYQEELLCLDYEGRQGAQKISSIMTYFRENITQEFAGKKLKLIEDYQSSTEQNIITGDKNLINLPKSNVLGLFFENGDIVYLRPSGTEPKIKFYLMVNETDGSIEEKSSQAEQKISKYIEEIKKSCEIC
jgi:phosphoglucomutase